MELIEYIKNMIEKIIQNNRKVNLSDLIKNLELFDELQKHGVNVGPDYQLGSPFSRPIPKSKAAQPQKGLTNVEAN